MAAQTEEQYYDDGQQYDDADATGESFQMPEGFEYLDTHIRNAHAPPRRTEEERFAMKVAQKRHGEMERRMRIFDAKRRTIGVDKPMLDQQVVENRLRKEQEQATARADDGLMSRCDKALKLMEIEKVRKQRECEKHCKDYSAANLNFASRREYDLNDPLAVRKGIPARLGDVDLRCGPSSMQQFNGEDLMKDERVRQQKAAMVNYIEQQKFEKTMINRANEGDAGDFAQEVADITALRNQMEDHEGHLRKELQRGQQTENLNRATSDGYAKRRQKDDENARNQQELDFHTTDPFLTENSQVTLAVPYKSCDVYRATYKGSTREERVDVAQTQRMQCGENDDKRGMERYNEFKHHSESEATRRHLVATERAKTQERRRIATDIAMQNRGKQEEDHKTKIDTNKMYTNKFSEEFFEQFGTGVR